MVENWMRIESLSIQQGNIFSSLASSNRLFLSSGMVKSVILFDIQHGMASEMASYGEYMPFVEPPVLKAGEIKSRMINPYSVLVFTKFRERSTLLATFKVESPGSLILFLVMLGMLMSIVIGFAIYIRATERREESKRVSLISIAIGQILEERDPDQYLTQNVPHLQEEWKLIKRKFSDLKDHLESSTKDKTIAQTATCFECRVPNAVVREVEKPIELSLQAVMSMDLVEPKLVSICIQPSSLANEILAELNSQNSSKFTFNGIYSKGVTDIIVTNDPHMAARIIEDDGDAVEVAEYQPGLAPQTLKARILRRYI